MLTARSPTRVLRCECRGWRLLGRSAPRGGTPLWSIDVLVGRPVRAAGGGGTPRRAGVAVATAHDLAWRRVLEWIDGGPALPDLRRFLEGVRELQHAEIVAVAADDLDPDRQPLGREAGGHRDRRMAGDGDVVAAFHPVEVIVHAGN